MGLDMYAFRFTKPSLPESVYTTDELRKRGYGYLTPDDLADEERSALYTALLPYMQELQVQVEYIDQGKIRKEFGFDNNPHIGMMSHEEVVYCGKKNGEPFRVSITQQDLEARFTFTQLDRCKVYSRETVRYWRKEYEISDFFAERIGPIENTGFYLIPAEVQREYNRRFNGGRKEDGLPEEEPTETTAILYWEWY